MTFHVLYSQVNAYLRLYWMETCLRLALPVSTAPVKEWRQQVVSGGWSGKGNNLSKLIWSWDTGFISWGVADGGTPSAKARDLSNLLSRWLYVPHCGHVCMLCFTQILILPQHWTPFPTLDTFKIQLNWVQSHLVLTKLLPRKIGPVYP